MQDGEHQSTIFFPRKASLTHHSDGRQAKKVSVHEDRLPRRDKYAYLLEQSHKDIAEPGATPGVHGEPKSQDALHIEPKQNTESSSGQASSSECNAAAHEGKVSLAQSKVLEQGNFNYRESCSS